MFSSNLKKYSINVLGNFKDITVENEFFKYYMGRSVKFIRPIILLLGILYLLFIIPDYFVIKNSYSLRTLFISRVCFFALAVFLYFFIRKIKNFIFLAYLITGCELIGIISFLFAMYMYETPNYFIQAFGFMVILLGIFLIPNKWINMVAVSILGSIAFIIMTAEYIKQIQIGQYAAGIVYIFIVIILSGISSFRNNYLKRKEYVNNKELKKLSETDYLTNIWNRSKFNKELQYWVNCSRLGNTPLSLIILDIDNFKKVNDVYGHLIGDEVIINTVNIVKSTLRKIDIFARWGGEEFVMLLPNTDNSQALEIAERIRTQIAYKNYEGVGRVTCSLGLVTQVENHQVETLLQEADKKLYIAKSAGKNRVVS